MLVCCGFPGGVSQNVCSVSSQEMFATQACVAEYENTKGRHHQTKLQFKIYKKQVFTDTSVATTASIANLRTAAEGGWSF